MSNMEIWTCRLVREESAIPMPEGGNKASGPADVARIMEALYGSSPVENFVAIIPLHLLRHRADTGQVLDAVSTIAPDIQVPALHGLRPGRPSKCESQRLNALVFTEMDDRVCIDIEERSVAIGDAHSHAIDDQA